MKFATARLLLAACMLLECVSAFGELKGGAERALYYMTYLLEEVYTDASKFTIATGCVGTERDTTDASGNVKGGGIRGQKGRCSLAEFAEYIWHDRENDDGTPKGDTKPDHTKFTKKKFPADTIGSFDTKKISNTLGDMTNSNKLNPGYFGGVDPDKVISGTGRDWDKMNTIVGTSAKNAAAEFDRVEENDLDSKADTKLRPFKERIKAALATIVDARRKDVGDMKFNSAFGIPKYSGNRMPKGVSVPLTPDSLYTGTIWDVDRDETIKAWLDPNNPDVDTKDKCAALLDKALDKIDETDGGKHNAALKSFQDGRDIYNGVHDSDSC